MQAPTAFSQHSLFPPLSHQIIQWCPAARPLSQQHAADATDVIHTIVFYIYRQQSASSLARQAVAEARSRGRRLGPSGRRITSPPHCSSSSALTVASERRRASGAEQQRHRSPIRHCGSPIRYGSPTLSAAERRRGVGQDKHDPGGGSHGFSRGQTTERRRAEHEAGRHCTQGRSSSFQHRDPATDTSHMHRQTHEAQVPFHAPNMRANVNATDTSQDDPAAAAPADSYLDNPNLIPVQQRPFGRPANATVPSEQFRSHPWQQQRGHQLPWPSPVSDAMHGARSQHPCYVYQHQTDTQAGSQHSAWHASHAPPPPPDDSLQPSQHDCDTALRHKGAQHASHDRGADSSDSSTSQLASQPQAANGLQAPGPSETVVASFGRQDTSRQNKSNIADTVLPKATAGSRSEPVTAAMSKHQAADAVKALIKPLYADKQLSKEHFKAIAQSCTHILADAEQTAGRTPHAVVQICMQDLGLNRPAALL